MHTINAVIAAATKAGFNVYGSFNEDGQQHEILTCTKGKFNGEVIDIYYNWNSGEVSQVEHSTQFKGQEPLFRLP